MKKQTNTPKVFESLEAEAIEAKPAIVPGPIAVNLAKSIVWLLMLPFVVVTRVFFGFPIWCVTFTAVMINNAVKKFRSASLIDTL